jgi:hypothetical protein
MALGMMTRRLAVVGAVAVLAIIMLFFAFPRHPAAGTPEEAADSLLRQLRSGEFDAVFAQLPYGGVNKETQMRERQYRLRWWWLTGHEQKPAELKLKYRVVRGWTPIPSPVWITVAQRDGKWRAVAYDAWY